MIPGLDGLRAVAFLLVFLFHTHYLDLGWIGVQFFFVLSGFLITGILLDMKKSLPAGRYFLKFYGRRFLRIFPLYYFYLFLMGVVTAWLISIGYRTGYMEYFWEQVHYGVFYVYNFMLATAEQDASFALEHLWSLSVEEQFYIFWPLLIILVPEKFQKRLFLALIAFGPAFRFVFVLFHASRGAGIFSPDVSEAIHPLPFTHADAFAFGAYISRYNIPKAREQVYVLFVLVPVIGFAARYLATGSIGELLAFGYPLYLSGEYQFIWGYSLLNYSFAVTIQAVARNGMFNRFLEWSPMRYLGKISYGLYVYHQPITWFAMDIHQEGLVEGDSKLIAALVAFFGTLLVAALSYHLMEKPILDLKDRFFPLEQFPPHDNSNNGAPTSQPLR